MKHIKEFYKFINEELREEEMNSLLDKISKYGIESLTDEERKELEEFDGEYDTTTLDIVGFDEEGDLIINGERANPYNISDDLYDDMPKKLDSDLKDYINNYLNNNFELKKIRGASKKQVFDKETNILVTPGELIEIVINELNIPQGTKGVRKYIQNWIKEYY